MCGIAGILSINKAEISQPRLKKMTDAIRHRGPEGEGFWINTAEEVGFGHRRLAIIDLTDKGAQPMHYGERYSMIFNGEIYNYLELKKDLEKKGCRFTSETDTEVILAAYAVYGDECLKHFDGMFAFALWDEQEKTLFAARDRFGEKPFYYHLNPQSKTFLFASEMKALWAAGIKRYVNHRMMLTYFALGYVQNPIDKSETFFEEVYALPPGCFLKIKLSKPAIELTRYYSAAKKILHRRYDLAESTAGFLQLFSESIIRRLRSDVPLGTSLSGGLDSSAIASMIARLQTSNPALTTFSAVFPGYAKDESSHIKTIANYHALKNHSVEPKAEDLLADFQKLCYYQEEPFASSSIYTQYRVYQLAAQHGVTVILDGQGADEILAGYPKYIHWFLQELLSSGRVKEFNGNRASFQARKIPFDWSWKNYLAAFLPKTATSALEKKATNTVKTQADLSGDYKTTYFDSARLNKPVVRSLEDILTYNTFTLGLEELLRYADRNSMAHSREVRLPFLYHKLVEFLLALPSDLKFRNGFSKYILREAMTAFMPSSICWRTDKVGFEPPQKKWMQAKSVQEFIQESRRSLFSKGILTKEALAKKIQPHDAHAADNFDWRYMVGAEILLQ